MSKDAGFSESQITDPETVFAALSELLEPEGWTLESTKFPTTSQITISHEVSTTRGIGLTSKGSRSWPKRYANKPIRRVGFPFRTIGSDTFSEIG
jgi:hypothetical protein